jgi:hypothetical protein
VSAGSPAPKAPTHGFSLPTRNHTVTVSDNVFVITAPGGATLRGMVVRPAKTTIRVAEHAYVQEINCGRLRGNCKPVRPAILIMASMTPLKRRKCFRLKPVLRQNTPEYRLQAEVHRGFSPRRIMKATLMPQNENCCGAPSDLDESR